MRNRKRRRRLGRRKKKANRRYIEKNSKWNRNRERQRRLTQARLKGVESGLSNLGKDYKAQEQRAIDNMAKFRAERDARREAVDKRLGEQEKKVGRERLKERKKKQRDTMTGNKCSHRRWSSERPLHNREVDTKLERGHPQPHT